jgi:hypothetical protein
MANPGSGIGIRTAWIITNSALWIKFRTEVNAEYRSGSGNAQKPMQIRKNSHL